VHRRPAGLAHREGHRGEADHVDVASVHLQRDVVAEPLRLFVGVDVAAHPGDQAEVVDDRPRVLVEPESLGEPQCDQRLPHHVLHRLAEAQVGPERDHRDQLGQPDASNARGRRHGAPSL